jgi:hypothetical protein
MPTLLTPVLRLLQQARIYFYQFISHSNQPASSDIGFNLYGNRIVSLLESHSASSAEVCAALAGLQEFSPVPPSEIVDQDVWGLASAKLRINSHLKSDFSDAVSNIERAGQIVTPEDAKYLRLILKHWCGWSATDSKHAQDSWVHFLRIEYPQINGLMPVLDSLVWPEEINHLPKGCCPIEPSMFLLANHESFYVFIMGGEGLMRAGVTLQEVYLGLKACRFWGYRDGDWVAEPSSPSDLNEEDYFPQYVFDGIKFSLGFTIRELVISGEMMERE